MSTITQNYQLKNRPDYSHLAFVGDLDAATVEAIRPLVQAQMPPLCRNIIVDLGEVDFLDSHGVGFFASLLKRCHRNGGQLYIAAAHGQPASVLRMVGFNNTLVVYCANSSEAEIRAETAA